LRKSPSGAWVLRDLSSTRSRAAGLISSIGDLLPSVEQRFAELLHADAEAEAIYRSSSGCVVFPHSSAMGSAR